MYTNLADTNVLPSLQPHSINSGAQLNTSIKPGFETLSAFEQVRMAPSTPGKQPIRPDFLVASNDFAKYVVIYFDKDVPEHSMVSEKVQELMLHAISQTATATFESTSMEIYAQDGYTTDDSGVIRCKTFVYSKYLQNHVCHRVSSFRMAFGCVWVRTTTIYHNDHIAGTHGKSQSVTSFVFYPTRWAQRLGVRNGLEAVIAAGSKSWLFNCRVTLTRAVPEDALIFDLCRTGQTQAVETILSKGIGSVVDTSPKGWKPLHVSIFKRPLQFT
jgi:hypothetical protein